jgi:carbon monoxide dehydrogenase subunit G
MTIESSTAIVEIPIKEVFDKLTKASTYERLMPEEASFRISDESHFSFKLGSMPVIPLKMERQTPHSQIVLAADGGNVPFELQANLSKAEEKTQIQLVFQGDINPMMQIMVKKPLTQFLEALIGNVQKL